MAHSLHLNIDSSKYRQVGSSPGGIYLVEANPDRRLSILLCVLFTVLGLYFYQYFVVTSAAVATPAPIEQVIRERHLSIDASIPVEYHQHPIYLYYETTDIMETFLPSG